MVDDDSDPKAPLAELPSADADLTQRRNISPTHPPDATAACVGDGIQMKESAQSEDPRQLSEPNSNDVSHDRARLHQDSCRNRLETLGELFDWPRKCTRALTRRLSQSPSPPSPPVQPSTDSTAEVILDLDADSATAASVTAAAASGARANKTVTDCDPEYHQRYVSALKNVMKHTSISTAFSGIDTPSVALAMIATGISKDLGEDMRLDTIAECMPQNKFAIEWLARSQEELMRHRFGPTHVFADMSSFWKDSVRLRIDALMQQQLVDTVLKQLVMTADTIKGGAYCVRCQRECQAPCPHNEKLVACPMEAGRPDLSKMELRIFVF